MFPKPVSLLFVCMGNICRSPAGAAVFSKLAQDKGVSDKFYVDSCGVTSFYLGCQADRRMISAAKKRDVSISHTAQIFEPYYFDTFDYILAVNHEVQSLLQDIAQSPAHKAKIRLLGDFSAKYPGEDIPDPYYGGEQGFEVVMDMLIDACEGLLNLLNKNI